MFQQKYTNDMYRFLTSLIWDFSLVLRFFLTVNHLISVHAPISAPVHQSSGAIALIIIIMNKWFRVLVIKRSGSWSTGFRSQLIWPYTIFKRGYTILIFSVLMIYVPVNNFPVMSGHFLVFLGWCLTSQSTIVQSTGRFPDILCWWFTHQSTNFHVGVYSCLPGFQQY